MMLEFYGRITSGLLGERLTERVVVMHALKNAFIPVYYDHRVAGPLLVGGAVIIENIFQLPGMGQLMVSSVQQRTTQR